LPPVNVLDESGITQISSHEEFFGTSTFRSSGKNLNLANEMTTQDLFTKYIRMEGWTILQPNLKVQAVQHESPQAQDRSFKLHYAM